MEARSPFIFNAAAYTPSQIEEALTAAKHTIPREITVTDYEAEEIFFSAIGCFGSGNKHQRQVARLMNELEKDFPISFTLCAGDNFYPHGATSPVDERFETFHTLYHRVFAGLGNHCQLFDSIIGYVDLAKNYVNQAIGYIPGLTTAVEYIPGLSYALAMNPEKHEEAGQQQIAHSILLSDPHLFTRNNGKSAGEIHRDEVSWHDLPNFLMPHFFYAINIEKVKICVLNSSTYAKDFLRMMADRAFERSLDPNNQAVWYQNQVESARANHQTIFTMQHHPFVMRDKRTLKKNYDAWHYLDPLSLTLLDAILKLSPADDDYMEKVRDIFKADYSSQQLLDNANYNIMLHDMIFIHQGIDVKNYIVAHSHNLNVFNNALTPNSRYKPMCQMNTGGGGEKSMPQMCFEEPESEGVFRDQFGCMVLKINKNAPENFEFWVCTVYGERLHFNNKSAALLDTVLTDPIPLEEEPANTNSYFPNFLGKLVYGFFPPDNGNLSNSNDEIELISPDLSPKINRP